MHASPFVTRLAIAAVLALGLGIQSAEAQSLRVEAGSGWAVPSSDVTMTGTVGADTTRAGIDIDSGPNVYASVGLVWSLSENFSLEGRIRGQQSWMRMKAGAFGNPRCNRQCQFLNDPSGYERSLTFEGQLTLTSIGRINPYFLVGLGVVRTTVEMARVQTSDGEDVIEFSEVTVTDGGGDIGFGATTPIAGNLRLTVEIRVTGSLPGAKENAVTVFPFTLGLSYEF